MNNSKLKRNRRCRKNYSSRKALFTSGSVSSQSSVALAVSFLRPRPLSTKSLLLTWLIIKLIPYSKSRSSKISNNIMAQIPQVQGYEHADAWDTNWLRVDETHELYYEQYGQKDGRAGE